MKYGLGYALTHEILTFFGRKLFYVKRSETSRLLDLLKDEKDKKILDFGCNIGHLTHIIKTAAPANKVYGADINMHALRLARRIYKSLRFYGINNKFFEKNKFDIVLISHVLEHIREREEFMENLSKIISDNGKIIIIVPQERIRGDTNPFHLLYNFIRLRFENPHVVKLDYNKLKNLLNKIGFEINKKTYINLFYPFKSNSRKFYSWSLIISASKI
jgi:2-polyprenyl-3-methyl-5-hydroxy-6-metoxy-1,4-benzoquinol methylase